MLKPASTRRWRRHRGGLPPVRQGEPVRQLARRFVWRLSVERHHRRRDARDAAQLGAPPVADGCYLDVVRAPADGFFETMHGHCVGFVGW